MVDELVGPKPDTGTAPTRRQHHRHYLMCRPDHYTVSYRINHWMDPARPTDTVLALRQWQHLHDTYVALGHEVELIPPVPGLPDMVFTANGGFVIDGVALGVAFRHEERQPEAALFGEWFREHGYEFVAPTEINEGEGDCLLVGDLIVAGHGFRSSEAGHRQLAEVFGREVVSLRLIDPRYYHLDAALTVLDPVAAPANIAYLPEAFDGASRGRLAERFPDAVVVDAHEAGFLGMNAISDGLNVVMSPRAVRFQAALRERGYHPIGVDLSEFIHSGGYIKCCTLELRRRP